MERLLEIKDLHVQYETDVGVIYAVNGLDIWVNKGETLGLVGETGAGKTTSALSVLKLLPDRIGKITSGSIVFDGTDIIHASETEMLKIRGNKVSMIFQDPMTSLNPILTVGDQIEEVLKLHRNMTKEERRKQVDAIMEMVGLVAERKTDYPHQFSGGMKQRIVIAMALACEPQLLLADEPTTALDVTIQAQVLQLMNNLKQKLNMAMILITHDLGIVAQTCDRVAVMYSGEIIEIGTVRDIFESDKHHPYTVGLFGSIPDMDKEMDRLQPIPGLMPDPSLQYRGCRFSDRCPHCTNQCKERKPSAFTEGTHSIWCNRFADSTTLSESKGVTE